MIKSGLNKIPDLEASKQEINKKQTNTEFLNDLKQIPQVYAQSVYRYQSDTNSISETTENSQGRFSAKYTEYLEFTKEPEKNMELQSKGKDYIT